MVLQVKALSAALDSKVSVGLEGWWSELIKNLTAPPNIDDYKGNKNPFSRDYTNLIKETFGNKRWVEELQLVDKEVSAGGIASRLIGIDSGKDYWRKVQTAIANASWLKQYADVIEKHSKATQKIHAELFKAWKTGAGGINKPLWEKAIADLEALDNPLDWAGKHSKAGLDGKMIKVRNTAGWALSKPAGESPKSLPALTQKQVNFAINFIVKVSNDEHELSNAHMELHRVAEYVIQDDPDKIWDEMFELDDTLFSKYANLTDYELVCDRLFKLVPGFRDHFEVAAALVIWVVRSAGSSAASLESFQGTTVSTESWWDTLVTAIVGLEKIDDYSGSKNPMAAKYDELMKNTFANPRWVRQQKLIEGHVSSGGVSSRFGGLPFTKSFFDDLIRSIDSFSSWVPEYIKLVEKYDSEIVKLHNALVEHCKSSIDVDAVKSAIAQMRKVPHPGQYLLDNCKNTIAGTVVKDPKARSGWTTERPESTMPKELPALTESQFAKATEIIVSVFKKEHLINKLSKDLRHAITLCDIEDGEKFWKSLRKADYGLYEKYSNEVNADYRWNDLHVPGLWSGSIQAGLVIWAARSCGSSASSLEGFQGAVTVSTENWWDKLVTAIVGVEDIDKYKGKKQPWSDDYKALIKRTFGNKRWVGEQKLIEGEVSGGGISKRLQGGFKSTDYLRNVQDALENSKWLTGYIKAVGQYSDEIIAIHKKTMEACKDGISKSVIKQAIKDIESLKHPKEYVLKHGKTSLDGEIGPSKSGNGWRTTLSTTKPLAKLPALNKEQFESAVKLINDLSSGDHPIMKLEDEFYEAGRFLEIDGDDFWEELQDFDENLYFAYTDVTYWQALLDDVYPPGLDGDLILAALVIWCGRSTGKTAASLESLRVEAKVDLETIAATAHEAVRRLAVSFGDHSHLSWEESPEWVRESALQGAALHVVNPSLTAEETHQAWLTARQEEGWACGPVKDAERKEHPCMVPYAELSREHRLKDHLFKGTVDAFMACLREDNPSVQVTGLECACTGLEQQYGNALDSRMPISVALESGGVVSRILEWFKGKEEEIPADLEEALQQSGGLIKKGWVEQQEFDSGTITDAKLVASLTYGDKVLSGHDGHIVSEAMDELWGWMDKAEGRWDEAISKSKPLIEAGLKAKKFDRNAITKIFISVLPRDKIPLPEGKVFECDGEFYGIRDLGVGKSVPKLKAHEVLKMQDAFELALSHVVDALSDLKHHYLADDLWAEEFKEIAEIQDSDDDWIGDSLNMDWYFNPLLGALNSFVAHHPAFISWVKASIKPKAK